jgi:hypothetical protein
MRKELRGLNISKIVKKYVSPQMKPRCFNITNTQFMDQISIKDYQSITNS